MASEVDEASDLKDDPSVVIKPEPSEYINESASDDHVAPDGTNPIESEEEIIDRVEGGGLAT